MSDVVFKSFQEMYNHYNSEGYVFVSNLSEKEYRDSGLKAHVVREMVNYTMRYVPLNGLHCFMFKSQVAHKEFNDLVQRSI